MKRIFEYKDKKWEVEATGAGHGIGAGSVPSITKFGALFRMSDSNEAPIGGYVSEHELGKLSEEQLCVALERALAKGRA